MSEKVYPLIDYESIIKILDGDTQEIMEMINFYEGLINRYSVRLYYSDNGKVYRILDEDKAQYIKLMLIISISKFVI